jgi:hypothetical protein
MALSSRLSISASFCSKARVNWWKLNNIGELWTSPIAQKCRNFSWFDFHFGTLRRRCVLGTKFSRLSVLIESLRWSNEIEIEVFIETFFIYLVDALNDERRRRDGRVARWTLRDPRRPHRTHKCEYFDFDHKNQWPGNTTCAANESESVANLFDYEKFTINLVFIHFRYRLIRQRMQHSKQL